MSSSKSGLDKMMGCSDGCTSLTFHLPRLFIWLMLTHLVQSRCLQQPSFCLEKGQNIDVSWIVGEIGEVTTNLMAFDIPSLKELMKSPLTKVITFSANSCCFSRSTKDLTVSWVDPLSLKTKAVLRKKDNPNWWDTLVDPFAGEYWKAADTEIEILKAMDA